MEKLRFIDATGGAPDYDSAEHSITEEIKAEGIAYNYLSMLEVIQGAGLELIVKDGAMISQGRTYIQDEPYDGASPKSLIPDAATTGYMRKDIVVVEYDIPNGVATAKIVKGAEAVSNPSLPTLLTGSTKWQKSLAVINITGGSITSIEDTRVIGNGRTNPVFAEDVSAPNFKIEPGGKYYIGTSSDYVYLSGGKLMHHIDGTTVDAQIAPLTFDTDDTPPAGTYAEGTIYLEHET